MVRSRLISALAVLPLLGASSPGTIGDASPSRFAALDGDTIVADGIALRIRGIDAPELGPWARCWSEAALAGHARYELERKLADLEREWRTSELSTDAGGNRSARLLDRKGYDMGEELAVAGYVARTDGRWNWCDQTSGLHDVLDGEQPPHGPSLWWPTGDVFDARAAD